MWVPGLACSPCVLIDPTLSVSALTRMWVPGLACPTLVACWPHPLCLCSHQLVSSWPCLSHFGFLLTPHSPSLLSPACEFLALLVPLWLLADPTLSISALTRMWVPGLACPTLVACWPHPFCLCSHQAVSFSPCLSPVGCPLTPPSLSLYFHQLVCAQPLLCFFISLLHSTCRKGSFIPWCCLSKQYVFSFTKLFIVLILFQNTFSIHSNDVHHIIIGKISLLLFSETLIFFSSDSHFGSCNRSVFLWHSLLLSFGSSTIPISSLLTC